MKPSIVKWLRRICTIIFVTGILGEGQEISFPSQGRVIIFNAQLKISTPLMPAINFLASPLIKTGHTFGLLAVKRLRQNDEKNC